MGDVNRGAFAGRTTSGQAEGKAIGAAEVRRALALFADPPAEVELRCVRPSRSAVRRGDDLDGLAGAALAMGHAQAVYFCLNPVQLGAPCERAASDEHVTRRRWLYLDVDSLRAAAKENCATAAEKAAAWKETEAVAAWLDSLGWPEAVWVDSGNGFYLIYRIDLPNDEPSRLLLRSLLHSLHGRFAGANIDRAVHNASRIVRLPGTWNQKGRNTPERPHRTCRLLRVPAALSAVTPELIALAAGAGAGDGGAKHEGNGEARKNPFKGRASDSRLEAYSRRALNDEVLSVAMAQRGHQGGHGANNTLNEAAFSMGRLLHWGVIDEAEVISLLTEAARRAGLDVDAGCGERGIEATINSGLGAGRSAPRPLPAWAANESSPPQAAGKEPPAPPARGKTRWEFTLDGAALAGGEPDEVREGVGDARDDGGVLVRRFDMLTIGALIATDFPEPEWVVKGLMSEGLNILAGAPKQGKSMLALNLALTVAGGGKALGDVRVNVGDVLYLSLEDKCRRVKSRAVKMLRKIQPDLLSSVSDRLAVVTDWPRQDEGGLKLIDLWVRKVGQPSLVIIDVWNRFAPAMQRNGNAYSHDAEAMGEVKRFAEKRGVSVLVVHHTRKPGMKEPEDFVYEISGTMGLSGAADGILVLMRSRQNVQASLHVTGRDVAEQELVLEFDEESLTWKTLGKKADHIEGKVQEKVTHHLRGRRPTSCFIKDIADAIGEKANSVRAACVALESKRVIRKVGNAYSCPGETIDDPLDDGEGEPV